MHIPLPTAALIARAVPGNFWLRFTGVLRAKSETALGASPTLL